MDQSQSSLHCLHYQTISSRWAPHLRVRSPEPEWRRPRRRRRWAARSGEPAADSSSFCPGRPLKRRTTKWAHFMISALIPVFSSLSFDLLLMTWVFGSLTVHERLHLGDWHGGAGCRFGRIGLWVRASGQAAQGADVQRVGGLDHGEVLLRHRHHLDLRGVRFLRSFCLKFLERATETIDQTDDWISEPLQQLFGLEVIRSDQDWRGAETLVHRTTYTPWFWWTKLNICFL